jgi:hypothetical protein
MELTPQLHRRLEIGGVVAGLALGATMSWTSVLASRLALRGVPIDTASLGLRGDVVALVTGCNLVAAALGGYVLARLWDRPVWAVVLAAGLTMVLGLVTSTVQTVTALAGNEYAELIRLQLPVGLAFGGWIWFLGGLIGAGLLRLALGGAGRLFVAGHAIAAWAVLLAVGIALGIVAGGVRQERAQAVLAARAVAVAIRQTAGEAVPPARIPPGYRVSGPAQEALRALGAGQSLPFTLTFVHDILEARESTIEARFLGGPVVRCVATGAWISRCFEAAGP